MPIPFGQQETYINAYVVHAENALTVDVPPNGLIGGSALNPAQVGTWKNISGNILGPNVYGLFMKVVSP